MPWLTRSSSNEPTARDNAYLGNATGGHGRAAGCLREMSGVCDPCAVQGRGIALFAGTPADVVAQVAQSAESLGYLRSG